MKFNADLLLFCLNGTSINMQKYSVGVRQSFFNDYVFMRLLSRKINIFRNIITDNAMCNI